MKPITSSIRKSIKHLFLLEDFIPYTCSIHKILIKKRRGEIIIQKHNNIGCQKLLWFHSSTLSKYTLYTNFKIRVKSEMAIIFHVDSTWNDIYKNPIFMCVSDYRVLQHLYFYWCNFSKPTRVSGVTSVTSEKLRPKAVWYIRTGIIIYDNITCGLYMMLSLYPW